MLVDQSADVHARRAYGKLSAADAALTTAATHYAALAAAAAPIAAAAALSAALAEPAVWLRVGRHAG